MDTTNDNDYFELEPFEQYKSQDSKFSASLKWLLSKSNLNTTFYEPFFEENELGKSLRNEIVKELINGRLYCATCKTLFNSDFETIADILDHLARNSVLVNDENDDPVTCQVIEQDSPFYVSAHLALIDSIMMYYSLRIMRFETVVNSLKKYSKLNQFGEIPTNLEQVCSFWLNRIVKIVLNSVENECDLYAKQSSLVRCQPHIYLNEIGNDLSVSLSNGTILAMLIVFYTCDLEIDLSDICLQENVGFEESVENLNLIKEFCEKRISSKSFYFTFEDFLYSPIEMNINKLAFIADLFYYFELDQSSNLVDNNHFEKFKEYLKKYTKKQFHATTPFLSARIGDVTRNSFIKKGSYAPGQSVNQANDNSKKLSTATSNSSSLLDNVSLDASNNFEIVSTNLSSSKFRLNDNGDYAEIEHDDDDDDDDNLINEEIPSDSNGMFSSRTYVKSSSSNNNRMNLNENTKIQADLSSNFANLNIGEVGNSSSGMKTVRVNSNNPNLPNITDQKSETTENQSSGLVRRLSVTARPGDIFYKVKDVTESSSTTDNCDVSENEPNESIEQEIIIKPQKQQESVNTNTWRKTTTWNVKRNNQTNQNETDSGRNTPKSEVSEKNSSSNIEPGSPMFTKELLSIRMQLKEKKSSMERDKRKLETELEKQRQTIGKQVFLQVVQKKSQTQDQQTEPIKQTESLNNSSCESPTPSQTENSPNTSNINREATRRQWDKTQKNFINELDQANKEEFQTNLNTGTSSVSSLSTPTSSASQSPPLNTNQKQTSPKSQIDSMAVDLSKAYYSRDEVIKAIESLKEKYINSSSINKVGQNGSGMNTPNNMVKDIEVLNNKLTELQAEINRLTLLQQNQPIKTNSSKTNDVDIIEKNNKKNEENDNNAEGSFFISFGNGLAKREKPTLTPKKNLIFIKTNDEKSENKSPSNTKPSNLLMTAIKQNSNNMNNIMSENTNLLNDGHDGDIDGSDGDTTELTQRKRELIIQKQLERRQQQEIRRLQLEEERARKAEELRQKEEELAMKKLIEKNRKETIFQAYIDKKKQSEIESMSGCFGPPQNNLLSAKKFHSTNRLRPPTKSNTQNVFDPVDQASMYSDRSTNPSYPSSTMVKTFSTNNLYQSNNKNTNTTKKQSRVSRPPSCARPTISSLRKMNRTFSLNNVSEVGAAPQEPKILPLTQASLAMANAASNSQNESVIRMNLLNDSNKLSSKYASSNYLNDYSRPQFQPQQTRTTPRRRTPRNPEEFLLAQGITDPEGYLKKGYYVGSMLDLTQFTKPSQNSQSHNNTLKSQQEENLQNPSSSSSSSMNGFQKTNKPFFLDTTSNVKRRNSVHETTSMSMANLNYIGTVEHPYDNSTMKSTSSRNQNYYRALNNYNKMRSMTTNIISTQNQYDDHSDQINDGSTNGSSAPGSDSSSSPTPSIQQKMNFHHSNGTTLGPLMSAVSKMDNLSTISPSSSKTMNTFLDHRYQNEDDYDDYEYLERNLGAEPLNSSFNQRKKQDTNTTTNTNVTDYYTDESNSCHNDEVLNNQFMQQFSNQHLKNANNNRINNNNNNNNNNSNNNNNNNNNNTSNNNINNQLNNKLGSNNGNQTNVHNNWDHTSLASTNSIYSGDETSVTNALTEASSLMNNRRLFKTGSHLDTSVWSNHNNRLGSRVMNTSFIISTSITSSSFSQNSPVNEDLSLRSSVVSPALKPQRKTWSKDSDVSPTSSSKMTPVHSYANNKTASNNGTGGVFNQNTTTYGRKRIPTSATFCSPQTPDNRTIVKRAANNNVAYQNQFMAQSPSLNLTNLNNEAEYSGPKLYKRLTSKTNKSTIVNSLNQLVLAGTVNAQLRKQVIEEIEASDARHFVILFRDYHLQYRGVYSYTSETDYIEKVIGQGPQRISEDMIEKYYKYNSGGKQFSQVQTKHLSIQCDAVTIHSSFWQQRKASNPVTNVNQMASNLSVLNHSQFSNYNQSPLATNQNTIRR